MSTFNVTEIKIPINCFVDSEDPGSKVYSKAEQKKHIKEKEEGYRTNTTQPHYLL
jgi:hypothetical protein